jgi:hypothetical protein
VTLSACEDPTWLQGLVGTDEETPVALSTDERAAIAASKAGAARGEFATDDQVRAVWAKHSL